MNHIYHTLGPVLLLAVIVLQLITFLSPTPLFPERVSMLRVTLTGVAGTSSQSTSTRLMARTSGDSIAGIAVSASRSTTPSSSLRGDGRLLRRKKREAKSSDSGSSPAAGTNSTTSANTSSTMTTQNRLTVQLYYGPLGACHRVDSSTSSLLTCQSPTLTPMFTPLYSSLTLPTSTQVDLLPSQFPIAPTLLMSTLVLLTLGWLLNIASSLGAKAPKWAPRSLVKRQNAWRRASMFCVGATLLAGIITTLSWRLDLIKIGKAINAHDSEGAMVASWGTGQQNLWIGWGMTFVSLALLVGEGLTR